MKKLPIEKIVKQYLDGASLHEIAEKYEVYALKIMRLLKKAGIPIRGKSDAIKSAVKRGRREHPTEGKIRTDKEKLKISQSLEKYYDNLSENEYNNIIERSKGNWKNLSKAKRAEMQRKSAASNRIAAKEGSSVEKYVKEMLEEEGYLVEFHKKNLLSTELEVDLFLPKENVAIEIDGPTHFRVIWDQDSLDKQRKRDTTKNGILINVGLAVVRVKYDRNQLNLCVKEKLKVKILGLLKEFKKKFPDKSNRLIEIEV